MLYLGRCIILNFVLNPDLAMKYLIMRQILSHFDCFAILCQFDGEARSNCEAFSTRWYDTKKGKTTRLLVIRILIRYKIIHVFHIEITRITFSINFIAPGMKKNILPGSKTRDQRYRPLPYLLGLHGEPFGPSFVGVFFGPAGFKHFFAGIGHYVLLWLYPPASRISVNFFAP